MPRALKGMVLAAGLGTRLRPLTDHYPKPLVPFAGSTPLQLALGLLARLGISDVAVNSHYRAEQVADFVQVNPFSQSLHLSHEPQLLGTGGAYPPLLAWLGDADLLVLNGDVVATFDLEALVAAHRAADAAATMLLLPAVIAGESAVFHAGGRVIAIGKQAPDNASSSGNFACAQILSPRFLASLPSGGVFDIVSAGYQLALQRGWTVAACMHEGYWHDLRTPQYYWQALAALLSEPKLATAIGLAAQGQSHGWARAPDARGVLFVEPTALPSDACIGPLVVIEAGAQVGARAIVRHSVLLPGAVVAPGAVVDHALLGPGMHVVLKPT